MVTNNNDITMTFVATTNWSIELKSDTRVDVEPTIEAPMFTKAEMDVVKGDIKGLEGKIESMEGKMDVIPVAIAFINTLSQSHVLRCLTKK